jgi:hypothetical protein
MTASAVNVSLVDGGNETRISFNNKTGAVTWGGNTLNLKNFANALKDDLVVKQAADGKIEVYNLSTQQKITLTDKGAQQLEGDKLDPASVTEFAGAASSLSTGLFINNTGLAKTASGGNDVVINRQVDASINAGLGDDKIFNFAATAGALNGGGGNDAVYSVGLTHATDIDVSEGDSYVKLLGNMNGGSISLGKGQNLVDAAGRTLTNVSIYDSAEAEASAVIAKTITGNPDSSTVSLQGALTALDVSQLTSSTVDFGQGKNSLVADKITGTATSKTSLGSTGANTYQVGAVTHTDVNSAGAISDAIKATGNIADAEFNLSAGENLLDASGKTLTAVKINSENGSGGTTVLAGSIVGRKADDLSSISLAGSGDNTIKASGTIKNAAIDIGEGTGTVEAGSIANATLSMNGTSGKLTVNGRADKLTYSGSNGADAIKILGAVSNSDFQLGEGENSVLIQNAKGVAQKVSNTNFAASGEGSTSLVMGAYTYRNPGAGEYGNKIALGAGKNDIVMGGITGKGTVGLEINLDAASAEKQTVIINGSVKNLTYNGSDADDDLSVRGGVSNSTINLGAGDNSFTAQNAKGAYQNIGNSNITATGSGSTSVKIGNYTYNAAQGNEISLGDGSNSIEIGKISGKGNKGLIIDLTDATGEQNVTLRGSANYLTYNGSGGADIIKAMSTTSNSEINLGAGDNSFVAKNAKDVYQSISNTNIYADGDGSTNLEAGKIIYTADGNEIRLGNGSNSIRTGAVSGKGAVGLDIDVSAAEAGQNLRQKLVIEGNATRLTYNGSNSDDSVTVTGNISYSEIGLGEGDNSFTANGAKSKLTDTNISAGGDGATALDINSFTTTGKSEGNITLGSGGNNVKLNTATGNVAVDMGGGGNNTFIANSLSGTSLTNGGGGDYTITKGTNAKLDFTGSSAELNLNIQSTLTGSRIDLGDGDVYLGSSYDKDDEAAASSANIAKTTVNAGAGRLTVDAGNISGSLINMVNGGDTAALDLSVNGTLNAQVDLGKGANDIKAKTVSGSVINREDAGSLNLEATTVTGTTFNLTGDGSDTLNVTGNLNANLHFKGDGGDTVSVGGAISGNLSNTSDMTLTAASLSGLSANLKGDNSITTNSLSNSKLVMGSGLNLIRELEPVEEPAPEGDEQEGAEGETQETSEENNNYRLNISGSTIESGSDLTLKAHNITNSSLNMKPEEGGQAALDLELSGTLQGSTVNLSGGDSKINVVDMKSSNVKRSEAGELLLEAASISGGSISLGDGADTINVSGTSGGELTAASNLTLTARNLDGMTMELSGAENEIRVSDLIKDSTLSSTGSNLVQGGALRASAISVGADGQSNQVLIEGAVSGSTLEFKGGANTLHAGSGFDSSRIVAADTGDNTIQGARLSNSTISTGASNNRVDIYGDITGSGIQFGGGANTLRNTLTAEEAAQNHAGQGSATNNKVQDSTIVMNGATNAYLGDVTGASGVKASVASNINIAALGSESTLDATKMTGGYVGIGTANGKIDAGTGGSLNVDNLASGFIADTKGGNTITVGTLGEQSTIQTAENIYSTKVHVNTLNGTVDLLKDNYGSNGYLTIADGDNYNGTVKIAGTQVTGTGTNSPSVATGGFGKGTGIVV